MSHRQNEFERHQREICHNFEARFFPVDMESKVGIALKTLKLAPINGLRHPPAKDTSGWYLWGGTDCSSDPDFFEPLHTKHLVDELPGVLKFLALPPGYRFLLDGSHLDVWYDATLLDV
jgi:hypothetical protein